MKCPRCGNTSMLGDRCPQCGYRGVGTRLVLASVTIALILSCTDKEAGQHSNERAYTESATSGAPPK